MKYSQAIALLSALVGFTSAAPAAESRQFKATITFTGAAASYTLEVPTDGSVFYTSEPREPPPPPTSIASALFPVVPTNLSET